MPGLDNSNPQTCKDLSTLSISTERGVSQELTSGFELKAALCCQNCHYLLWGHQVGHCENIRATLTLDQLFTDSGSNAPWLRALVERFELIEFPDLLRPFIQNARRRAVLGETGAPYSNRRDQSNHSGACSECGDAFPYWGDAAALAELIFSRAKFEAGLLKRLDIDGKTQKLMEHDFRVLCRPPPVVRELLVSSSMAEKDLKDSWLIKVDEWAKEAIGNWHRPGGYIPPIPKL